MSEFERELSVLRTRHNMLMDALGFKRDATLEGVVIEDVRALRSEMVKARQALYTAHEFDELAQVFWEEKSQFAAKLWRMGRSYLQRAQDAEQKLAVLQISHDSAVRATLIREKALKIPRKSLAVTRSASSGLARLHVTSWKPVPSLRSRGGIFNCPWRTNSQ